MLPEFFSNVKNCKEFKFPYRGNGEKLKLVVYNRIKLI